MVHALSIVAALLAALVSARQIVAANEVTSGGVVVVLSLAALFACAMIVCGLYVSFATCIVRAEESRFGENGVIKRVVTEQTRHRFLGRKRTAGGIVAFVGLIVFVGVAFAPDWVARVPKVIYEPESPLGEVLSIGVADFSTDEAGDPRGVTRILLNKLHDRIAEDGDPVRLIALNRSFDLESLSGNQPEVEVDILLWGEYSELLADTVWYRWHVEVTNGRYEGFSVPPNVGNADAGADDDLNQFITPQNLDSVTGTIESIVAIVKLLLAFPELHHGEFGRAKAILSSVEESKLDGSVRVLILHYIGVCEYTVGSLSAALAAFSKARDLYSTAPGMSAADRCKIGATVRNNLGLVLARSGDLDGAIAEYEASLSELDHPATSGLPQAEVADLRSSVFNNLSNSLRRRGRFAEAQAAASQCVTIREQLAATNESERVSLARAYVTRAKSYESDGNFAYAALDAASAVSTTLSLSDPEATAIRILARERLARALASQNKLDESIAVLDLALQDARDLDDGGARAAALAVDYGKRRASLGHDIDMVIANVEAAVATLDDVGGIDAEADRAYGQLVLGQMYRRKGRTTDARVSLERAVSWMEENRGVLGYSRAEEAGALALLAAIRKDEDRRDEAHELYERSIEIWKSLAGMQFLEGRLDTMVNYATTLEDQDAVNMLKELEGECAKAVERGRTDLLYVHGVIVYNLGRRLHALGDAGQAAQSYSSATEVLTRAIEHDERVSVQAALVRAHNNLGMIKAKQNDLTGARREFESALAYADGIPTDRVRTLLNLARCCRLLDDVANARTHYQTARRLLPDVSDTGLRERLERGIDAGLKRLERTQPDDGDAS